jgi:CRP-like cAMP-binding protein
MEAKASRTSKIKSKKKTAPIPTFDAQAFLDSAGAARKVAGFQRKKIIFSQGDDAKYVMYIQKGSVKLSIVNEVGREAVVAILGLVTFLVMGASQGTSSQTIRRD